MTVSLDDLKQLRDTRPSQEEMTVEEFRSMLAGDSGPSDIITSPPLTQEQREMFRQELRWLHQRKQMWRFFWAVTILAALFCCLVLPAVIMALIKVYGG